MKKIILNIGGMSCSACSSGLEKYLRKQEGIISANVNLVMAQAMIEYEESLTLEDLERFVSEAGFDSLGVDLGKEEKKEPKKITFVLFALLAGIILYISMSHMIGLPTIPFLSMMKYPKRYAAILLVLTIPFLIYGKDIFQSGIKNIIHKTPNMDTLVSLGVASSFIYSIINTILIFLVDTSYVHYLYFESCAIILFFIKLGRFIDQKSKEKTKEAIKELVQITPSVAIKKEKGIEKEVTLDEIVKKDILICKPGMKIATDGTIKKGEAHFDEAFITGESLPVKKKIGDKVIAGSMNMDGYIEYEAERIGKDSTISEIVRLVVEATSTKAPIQKLADIVSGYFVPSILVIAILTLMGYLLLGFSFSESISAFVTVLVVACPCALGLATPLAIVVSEGLCAKNGILVKSSEILENAHKVDTIVFDKTGTLTYGKLQLAKKYNFSNYKEKELIQIVSSIEAKSTHPISNAFLDYSKENHIKIEEVKEFENIAGIGIKATMQKKKYYIGNHKLFSKLQIKNPYEQEENQLTEEANSIVYVLENKKVIGLFGVKDVVRENAKEMIQKLKEMKKEIVMLTGDNEKTATQIANSIGITKVISDVLPKEKTKVILDFKKEGKLVMMVGDGINDAPSLATCDIGVSMNSGTDVAMDSSDVVLMKDNLNKIPALISISKKTLRNIKQNLFWAFFYNVCMIPLAIGFFKPLGLSMNPMIAGIAMTCSSLTVILNALRLKRWKEE